MGGQLRKCTKTRRKRSGRSAEEKKKRRTEEGQVAEVTDEVR